MRRSFVLVLALAAASPAGAQRSGLLLGLSSDSGYRTLFIAPATGRLTVAATQAQLIVPRPDGFHHVGVVRWCSTSESGEMAEAGPFVDETDRLIDRSIGSAAPQPDSGYMTCPAAYAIVAAYRDSVARVDSIAFANAKTGADSVAAQREYPESEVCGFGYIRITYLSSSYVSTFEENGSTEFCNPGRYTWSPQRYTIRLGAGTVGLLPLLAPKESKRVSAQWEREKGDCALEASPDDSWGIVRSPGAWHVAFATSGATACRGRSGQGDDGFAIVLQAPRAVARRDLLAPWLPAVNRAVPKANDVFVSPLGDLVIVREGTELSAFTPHGRTLGPPVLRVKLRSEETLVMAEWATGAWVQRWASALAAVHESW